MVMVRPKQSEMLVTAAGCWPFRLNITHCGRAGERERMTTHVVMIRQEARSGRGNRGAMTTGGVRDLVMMIERGMPVYVCGFVP